MCNISRADVWRERPSSRKKNNRVSVCSYHLRYLYMPLITTLSILLQPILDGRRRQNAPASTALSETSQPNPATNKSKSKPKKLQRSNLTEVDHIQEEVTCESHLTQLFFGQESLQEKTASMMRKTNTARCSPHCAALHPFWHEDQPRWCHSGLVPSRPLCST